MKLQKSEITSLSFILLTFLIGWYVYPLLPERVASHWNMRGEVDGYISRFWGAFLLPVIFSATSVLLIIIPKIDPKSKNIEKFRNYFDRFILLLYLFFLYIYGLTLAWNFGYRFNMISLLSPAFSILFYFTGDLITHSEMNWSIGIRTPWTLSNPSVWKKTHSLGGILFKIVAALVLLGLVFPENSFWFFFIPMISATIFLFVYSYFEYKKIENNG